MTLALGLRDLGVLEPEGVHSTMSLPVTLGQVIANKYRVDHEIGTGGMGVVFAGFHLELEQPVAIKFLSSAPHLKPEAEVRFRREARAAAKIHSEHVVRVYDAGLLEDTPYLVMELLRGNDLEKEVEARGRLPLVEAVSYVLQAIDAIAEAHAAGIVHRDLKPTNLYLAERADGARILKVLDFGISKSMVSRPEDVALTRTSAFVGSPLFMSPEQMRSARDVDSRTDIWALGAILYGLLTAELPFRGDSLPQLCTAVLTDSPRPLTSLLSSAPPELEGIVFKCLARERDDRYATVAELAAELVSLVPEMRPYALRAARVLSRNADATSLLPSAPPEYSPRLAASSFPPPDEHARRSSGPSAIPGGTQTAWDEVVRRSFMMNKMPVILGLVVVGAVALVLGMFFRKNASDSPVAPQPVKVAEQLAPASPPPSATLPADPRVVDAEPVSPPPAAEAKTPEPERVPTPATALQAHSSVSATRRVASARAAASSATPPGGVAPVPYLGGRR